MEGEDTRGPGGTYAQGAYGGGSYYHANTNVNQNINVNTGLGRRLRSRLGRCSRRGRSRACGGPVAAAPPTAAQPVVVNNQNYYFAGGSYYQPCYQGADVSYCVVANPNY